MEVRRTSRRRFCLETPPAPVKGPGQRQVVRRKPAEPLVRETGTVCIRRAGRVAGRKLDLGQRADAAWREARKARAEAWIRRAGWSAMAARNVLGAIFCIGWICFAWLTLIDSSIPEGVLRSQYRAVWGWLLLVLMSFPIVSAVGGWTVEWIGRGLQYGLRWMARRRHIDVEA